jgi:hypothetical protein
MGWNDHMEGIDPADPDPGATLRERSFERADYERKAIREGTICKACLAPIPVGQSWCSESCRRAEEHDYPEEEHDV